MSLAQVLNLNPPHPTRSRPPRNVTETTRSELLTIRRPEPTQSWTFLLSNLKCNGRVSCLFSDNRREEQARKALESALGGKKNEFEKWDKEIKKREEVGGGGDGGRGGWFGFGGWSNGDHFWQEAQQTSLAVLGILVMYLIVAKGELMFAFVINPLLFGLRGARNGLSYVTRRILRVIFPDRYADFDDLSNKEVVSAHISAKERVTRKWGKD